MTEEQPSEELENLPINLDSMDEVREFLSQTLKHIELMADQSRELRSYADRTIELIKIVEDQEKKIRELERNRVVTEMAGAAAHALNQPLAVVQGYLELLLKDEEDGSKRAGYLRQAADQIEKMAGIIEKLKAVTSYVTTDYAGDDKIIDLEKAGRDLSHDLETIKETSRADGK